MKMQIDGLSHDEMVTELKKFFSEIVDNFQKIFSNFEKITADDFKDSETKTIFNKGAARAFMSLHRHLDEIASIVKFIKVLSELDKDAMKFLKEHESGECECHTPIPMKEIFKN